MQLIKACHADLDQLAEIAAQAYQTDPLQQWIMKKTRSQKNANVDFFKLFLRPGIQQGNVFTEPQKRGFIFWQPVDQIDRIKQVSFETILALFWILGWRTKKILSELEQLAALQPSNCHYLQAISIHPDFQQLGIGKKLFLSTFAEQEQQNTPVYCETANLQSLAFYKSLGFTITGQHQIKNGPKIWLLKTPTKYFIN